ncbi:MAG: hypothetical protein KDD34_09415 [Bdellovibrionales bacterium]|nr:hypothetical protein [Bdellovibrionales bacterium]
MRQILIFILFLFGFQCLAAHEMTFDEVWNLNNTSLNKLNFDISIYLSTKSSWTKKEIQSRLKQANNVFQTCSIQLRHVYVYSWKSSEQNVRVDEFKSDDLFYDGVRLASEKSMHATPLQLFYFNDYLEPFTSGPSLPFAIYPDNKVEETTFNTAWFPYFSAQRQKHAHDQYSEEAHEIGHILLRQGHDHSGMSNIMANDSKKRTPYFNKEQCHQLSQSFIFKSQSLIEDIYPIFNIYYATYSKDFYMADWCSRNSLNLAQAIQTITPIESIDLKIVYVIHKNQGQSLYPLQARARGVSWKFHAFLLVNDRWVLDLDYTDHPQIVSIDKYLPSMFGTQVKDLKLKKRDPTNPPGFTYQDILKVFNDGHSLTL